MAVVYNGWCSVAAGALTVARHLRRFILVATAGAALLWSTSQPASSAEKIIADYGGTKAYMEGVHWFRSNREASLKVLRKYMRTDEKEILEETYDYFASMMSPALRVNPEGIQEILTQEAQRLPAASRRKLADFVSERLLDELDREGFTQRFR